MLLPQNFDKNEWFIIIGLLVSYTLILRMPKKLPISITILIMLFSATIARMADHLLAAPNIDLYDITDTGKYELFDFLTYMLYGPFAYLFVYIYVLLSIKGIGNLLYIITWSLLATLFEGITALFDIFNYKNWELSYSFTAYLMIQSYTLLFYKYISKKYTLLHESKKNV
ncbi:hypothetical protein [Bacillus sp. Marseille-P3661]|uniref:hypothetical protein n=1 Tax=Bacillus sp. Marseille-P3661 TaxID=1936234 RepID=UPI000C84FA54|nr:hypothetical protein [Bacillus sp. Marseille-P3661]